MRGAFTTLLFLLPVLVLFGLFRVVPMAGAAALSLADQDPGGGWTFAGVANYRDLAASRTFRTSLRTTLGYVAICVPLTVLVALGTALLLDRVTWARSWFRTALLAPYVTSLVLAAVVWRWLFEPLGVLGNPSLVLPALAVVSVWKGFGYSMLVLFAGLQDVPPDCVDAARTDGASAWQRLRHVLLPFLRPALAFVVVIETIGAFQVFDTVYVMTGGGPVQASYTLAYAVYDYGFRMFDLGHAAAAGIVLWAVVLLVSLTQRRVFGRGT
ncbi:carbohydrate ABC transporter permease [Nocardia sp. NRRL S-836]|uniref:carbohydrate ABC transporter permease n=1 Tax=Nocardia sp. NRRL S-836 TaxID=1519492 RepID=UPI0006C51F85|nr:sugar ABC transporter permease [Nocardia sp. NRRL S-836]KOV84971.1 sugar ABC transporter permease [Nocardia sp. NRRL S-836]